MKQSVCEGRESNQLPHPCGEQTCQEGLCGLGKEGGEAAIDSPGADSAPPQAQMVFSFRSAARANLLLCGRSTGGEIAGREGKHQYFPSRGSTCRVGSHGISSQLGVAQFVSEAVTRGTETHGGTGILRRAASK